MVKMNLPPVNAHTIISVVAVALALAFHYYVTTKYATQIADYDIPYSNIVIAIIIGLIASFLIGLYNKGLGVLAFIVILGYALFMEFGYARINSMLQPSTNTTTA